MKKIKQMAVCLSLVAALGPVSVGAVGAQENRTVIQDGIRVEPLSRANQFISEEQLNQAAAQQYTQMMGQAQQKGVPVYNRALGQSRKSAHSHGKTI